MATLRERKSESLPPPKQRRIAPPAASNPPQSPGYARSIPSGHFVNNFLLNDHARTHQATDESDNDSEDALERDATEATDPVGPGTNDLWNEEDVNMEDEVDLREGIVSGLDILAEEFVAEAEELGKSKHYLLHTP